MPDLHDLAPAYALDALDDVERAAFERHLVDCADCAAEVASFAGATGELAWAAESAPPAELKDRVMAALDQPAPENETVADEGPAAVEAPAPVESLSGRRIQAWRWLSAAAVIALVLTVWSSLGRDADADRIAAVEDADDATVVALQLETGPATLTYSLDLGEGVLTGADLAALPNDNVYELWLIDDTGPASAGIFHPDDSTIVFEGVAAGQTFALTDEPPGGSGGIPTGDVLVDAEL